MKTNSNIFVRIAVSIGLPNFISPNDPQSQKGEHNTQNTLSQSYLKVPPFCDRGPLWPVHHYIIIICTLHLYLKFYAGLIK